MKFYKIKAFFSSILDRYIYRGPEYHIVGIVGEPGVGKSCVCQQLVDIWVAEGVNVWSTKEFNGAMKITLDQIKNYNFFNNNMQGGVLILDEAGIDFNSREYKSMDRELLEFFKYYRHFKLNIYVVSQGIDVDLAIRRLIDKWYKLVRVTIPLFGIKTNYVELVHVDQELVIEQGDWKILYLPGSVEKVFNISKSFSSFNSFSLPEGKKSYDLEKWNYSKKENIVIDEDLEIVSDQDNVEIVTDEDNVDIVTDEDINNVLDWKWSRFLKKDK